MDDRLNEALRNGASIEATPGWFVVWYWADENRFTNMKFMDYEDALEFMLEQAS